MFQVYNKQQSLCSHPRIVYPTPYDSLYISLSDGFDMKTGEPIHKFKSDTGAISLKNTFYSSNNKTVDEKQFQIYENIDFEAHIGTKIGYLHFNKHWQLQTSTLELLMYRNDGQLSSLERSTILNILMISHENPRLAGYILTTNRSMFIKPNGNVAWLNSCSEFISPLKFLVSAITENQFFMKMKCISLIRFLDKSSLKRKNNCALVNNQTYLS